MKVSLVFEKTAFEKEISGLSYVIFISLLGINGRVINEGAVNTKATASEANAYHDCFIFILNRIVKHIMINVISGLMNKLLTNKATNNWFSPIINRKIMLNNVKKTRLKYIDPSIISNRE